MTKLTELALIAGAVFVVTSANAGEKGCCAAQAKNGKMHCAQTYAKLNLSSVQKAKLEKLEAQCNKAGCTRESMDKFMKSAESILSKDQYAALKAECARLCAKGSKA